MSLDSRVASRVVPRADDTTDSAHDEGADPFEADREPDLLALAPAELFEHAGELFFEHAVMAGDQVAAADLRGELGGAVRDVVEGLGGDDEVGFEREILDRAGDDLQRWIAAHARGEAFAKERVRLEGAKARARK